MSEPEVPEVVVFHVLAEFCVWARDSGVVRCKRWSEPEGPIMAVGGGDEPSPGLTIVASWSWSSVDGISGLPWMVARPRRVLRAREEELRELRLAPPIAPAAKNVLRWA